MATLNVRVDDNQYERLKQKAEEAGESLSEFVRNGILALVVPVDDRQERPLTTPVALTPVERQSLALLHRILARVLPDESNLEDGDFAYQLERAKVLEEGYTASYETEFAGIQPELTPAQCDFVLDVLDMFRIITFSIQMAEKAGAQVQDRFMLEFCGFDHNDSLEGHMASYVEYLMEDRELWTELQPQRVKNDNGNSHHQTIPGYQRMLAEYRRIKESRRRGRDPFDYRLDGDELKQIADAAIHPSNRPPVI